jgi:hypothetical protein
MLDGYVRAAVCGGDPEFEARLRRRARVLRPLLPSWYAAELRACSAAAGVDEDLLLVAQCEGDLRALNPEAGPQAGCSAYVCTGTADAPKPAFHAGRNFDYIGGPYVQHCALVLYVEPDATDGMPFVAVGWSGILGGWTLVNAAGLIIANHLGGGPRCNAHGLPTLVLTRMLAQKARTVDEAVDRLRNAPRMRGQIVWLAQPAADDGSRPARAVAVEYDAEDLFLCEADAGVLLVSNTDRVFDLSGGARPPRPADDAPSRALLQALCQGGARQTTRAIAATWRPNTLHSVEVFPERGMLQVAHGVIPAQDGPFVAYPLPGPLLGRADRVRRRAPGPGGP